MFNLEDFPQDHSVLEPSKFEGLMFYFQSKIDILDVLEPSKFEGLMFQTTQKRSTKKVLEPSKFEGLMFGSRRAVAVIYMS